MSDVPKNPRRRQGKPRLQPRTKKTHDSRIHEESDSSDSESLLELTSATAFPTTSPDKIEAPALPPTTAAQDGSPAGFAMPDGPWRESILASKTLQQAVRILCEQGKKKGQTGLASSICLELQRIAEHSYWTSYVPSGSGARSP